MNARKRPPLFRFYTKAQLLNLMESVKGEAIETPVRLCGTYGLRRSEALGLQWSAIDFNRNTISIHHTVRSGAEAHRRTRHGTADKGTLAYHINRAEKNE